mmetsp:Transcript_10769/g.46660  ORF Transcript_10769/g.46660 Transcript_10769/m.46660 type:complete len:90 (+) Transcript_10769:3129-3398(+)
MHNYYSFERSLQSFIIAFSDLAPNLNDALHTTHGCFYSTIKSIKRRFRKCAEMNRRFGFTAIRETPSQILIHFFHKKRGEWCHGFAKRE